MNKYILGISCYFHDSAICLLKNGQIISAVQEERFTGIKNDSSFPYRSIQWCLKKNNITSNDLSYIIFYEKPLKKFLRVINSSIDQFPASRKYFVSQMRLWLSEKMWTKTNISKRLNVDLNKIIFCQHHLSHASSIYYNSNLDDSTIMVSDGVGEDQSFSIWQGKKNSITLLYELKYPNSLGLFYSTITSYLGHNVNNGENKVMSMSAYGNQNIYKNILKIIKLDKKNIFKQDFKYFSYQHSITESYSKNLINLLGNPRSSEDKFLNDKDELDNIEARRFANIAFSAQKITEEIIKKKAELAYNLYPSKNLCLSGGVHLNCLANFKALKDSRFENIYSNNYSSDSGAAVGAALWAWKQQISDKSTHIVQNTYSGPSYSSNQIEETLKHFNYKFIRFKDYNELIDDAVYELNDGKIIAWFQDGLEFGKRALGNRSILARPDKQNISNTINKEIKKRESYQPFAASILSHKINDFFYRLKKFDNSYKYMNVVAEARLEKINQLTGVLHVDKTSRIQAVCKEDNELFFNLIQSFYNKTNIPVLLNTSFNLKGETIVDNPVKAISTFLRSNCDDLYLNKFKIINDL